MTSQVKHVTQNYTVNKLKKYTIICQSFKYFYEVS